MRRLLLLLLLLTLAGCSGLPGFGPEPPAGTAVAGEDEQPGATAQRSRRATATPRPQRRRTATPEQPSVAVEGGLAGSPGLGDPLYPELGNGGYDVQHYTIDLDVDVGQNAVDGSATLEALATQELGSFNLDFAGLEVASVTVDGQPATFERDDAELRVIPEEPIAAQVRFEVTVVYSGSPEPVKDPSTSNFTKLGWIAYERGIYVVSEPSGSMSWYPVNNHPADKATYTFRIAVDEPYVVAANGVLQEELEDGGRTTYVWQMDEPMASYLATVHIADFEVETSTGPGGVAIRNYFPAGTRESLKSDFDRTPEMMAYVEEVLGPYPFDAYGVAVVDLPLGFALETQTLSTFGKSFTTENTVMHELVHQWIGNSLSPATWQDIWINEGFASYFEVLWGEREMGREVMLESMEQTYRDLQKSEAGPPVPGRVEDLFSFEVYMRGSWTLHALRLQVGDEAFFQILRTFYERHAGGNASTADFIDVAVEIGGEDARDLLEAWLYDAELPPR